MNLRRAVLATTFTSCLWMWYTVLAQETPKSVPSNETQVFEKKEATPRELRDGQLAISGRYSRFERMLSQMADVLGRQDPDRADLLRRAIGKGREEQVKEDIEKVVELLSKGDLGTASEKQSEVVASLGLLLKLLQSEDRRSSVERERERLNELLKEVRTVLAEQKSARSATQNAEAPSSAAPAQQKALSETERLLKVMREHDNQKNSEEQGGKDGITPDGESKNKEQKDSDAKDGEAKRGEKGESQESELQSEQTPGQPSGKDESTQTPGRQQLEKAQKQMQQALEELKGQERRKALKNEDEAIEELHDAAAKLEEKLKQLREEEKEMLLASLEARFQRMLAAETQIQDETVSLAATPLKDWLDQYYGRCRELTQQQVELTTECAQTVNLLREDGTSVSILMTVEDIESDMGLISGWLTESRVGELTQSVQNDIIESLKLLIETTQKEMQEMQEQQQNQQQQNSEKKQGLVELMAEVRMLRNLQVQVNRRTKQVDGLLQSASADELPVLMKQVHDLAVRQQRLVESANELAKQSL